jgi:TRAP-type C4-dicarboxylate transport system substrate-binding protein
MHDITEITKHLAIAQLALDLHCLKNAAKHFKDAYHDKLRESDMEFNRMDPRDEKFLQVIEFTKDEYKAHQAAKRKVYNAQRRLDTACRKVVV